MCQSRLFAKKEEVVIRINRLLVAKQYYDAFSLAKNYYGYDEDKTSLIWYVFCLKDIKSLIDQIKPLADEPGPFQAEAAYALGYFYSKSENENRKMAVDYLRIGLLSRNHNSAHRYIDAYRTVGRHTFDECFACLQKLMTEFSTDAHVLSALQYAIGMLHYENRSNPDSSRLAAEAFDSAITLDCQNIQALKALSLINDGPKYRAAKP